MSYHRYKLEWGNYKSDKYKSRKTLKEEIKDILALGKFSVADLRLIKDTCKERGFRHIALKKLG